MPNGDENEEGRKQSGRVGGTEECEKLIDQECLVRSWLRHSGPRRTTEHRQQGQTQTKRPVQEKWWDYPQSANIGSSAGHNTRLSSSTVEHENADRLRHFGFRARGRAWLMKTIVWTQTCNYRLGRGWSRSLLRIFVACRTT